MKYKVGDTVQIRSKEWIDAQPKNVFGSIDTSIYPFNIFMSKYAGKHAKIISSSDVMNCYKLDIDHGAGFWADEMFEESFGDIIAKESVQTAQYAASKPLPEALTLRDYFAGCALTGLLSSEKRYPPYDELVMATYESYKYADKMLEARNEK